MTTHPFVEDDDTDSGAWRAVMTWPLDEGAYGCHLLATWGCGQGIVWQSIQGAAQSAASHPAPPVGRSRGGPWAPAPSRTYQRTPGGGLAALPWTPCLRTLELGTEYLSLHGPRRHVWWPALATTAFDGLSR